MKELAQGKIADALNQKDKHTRIEAVERAKKDLAEELLTDFPDNPKDIHTLLGDVEYHSLRSQVLESGHRVDGRTPKEVRPISIDTGLLPRAHGSALFTRGQTQALVVATLGTADDVQRLDTIDDAAETTKSFMLHYNFPPFSTGEVRPMRGTSRREIGHGNLAERALQGVLPPFEEFPYTIRIVSDVLESNGSSSMASVCGGSLALFDGGVPMRAAVAGVAMGLIKEGSKYAILTDILGTEDHLGDMDFKVAGTENGITSIQMDIKIEGLDLKIMREALDQAREGRLHILGEMNKALSAPRPDLSPYAPRIVTVQINPEKIGDLIGPKGKTIRGIQDETGAEISVDDSGTVTIAAVGGEAMERARQMVQAITQEPIVGEVYEGLVKSTTAFGAFVEILPGTEALLHISEMRHGRTEKTEDVVKKGDRVKVKLIDRDERGRLRLSMKALQPKPEGEATEGAGNGSEPRRERSDRGDRGSREPVGAAAGEGDEPSYSAQASGEGEESSESTESRASARGSAVIVRVVRVGVAGAVAAEVATASDAARRYAPRPGAAALHASEWTDRALGDHAGSAVGRIWGLGAVRVDSRDAGPHGRVAHARAHGVQGHAQPHGEGHRVGARGARRFARCVHRARAHVVSGARPRRAPAAGGRCHRRSDLSAGAAGGRPVPRAEGRARGDQHGGRHARRPRVRAA